jgi:HTH-type transcriptional regulator/antitoxin HipB
VGFGDPKEGLVRIIRTSRELGAAIRRARKERGLSQADLAKRAGVGRPWLSKLETGKRTAEIGRALTVVSVLGLGLVLVPVACADPRGIDLDSLLSGGALDDA